MQKTYSKKWKVNKQFLKISSTWLTIFGERLTNHEGKNLDYWRVEKPDSVIALTLQKNRFVLPPKEYRPGISCETLDFPGGRIPKKSTPEKAIRIVIRREMAIDDTDIVELMPLNKTGWHINSSFSNQHLFGYVAKIDENVKFNNGKGIQLIPTTVDGIEHMLTEIKCLQCRVILLEWLLQIYGAIN